MKVFEFVCEQCDHLNRFEMRELPTRDTEGEGKDDPETAGIVNIDLDRDEVDTMMYQDHEDGGLTIAYLGRCPE